LPPTLCCSTRCDTRVLSAIIGDVSNKGSQEYD
jgi:hypothetical protein